MDQSKCVVVANRPKSVSRARAENDPKRPVSIGRNRPKADHGHAVNAPVMWTQVMSFILLASRRVSGATLKPNKELRMEKEFYATPMAINITPDLSPACS